MEIAIIGLGLIGGSIAKAIKKYTPQLASILRYSEFPAHTDSIYRLAL